MAKPTKPTSCGFPYFILKLTTFRLTMITLVLFGFVNIPLHLQRSKRYAIEASKFSLNNPLEDYSDFNLNGQLESYSDFVFNKPLPLEDSSDTDLISQKHDDRDVLNFNVGAILPRNNYANDKNELIFNDGVANVVYVDDEADAANINIADDRVVYEYDNYDEEGDDVITSDTVRVLNNFGKMSLEKSISEISQIVSHDPKNLNSSVFSNALDAYTKVDPSFANKYLLNQKWFGGKNEMITVGTVVCGDREEEFNMMLKTAVMFSLDTHLHFIVFSDNETILKIGEDILGLKLGLNKVGHNGFTFELHLERYPHQADDPDWKTLYGQCGTQRLFFPSLLRNHDAIIYLDPDTLVLSSLREMWKFFNTELRSDYMVAITPNSETPSVYNTSRALPYYGEPSQVYGINTGVMMLNLTQLREFEFEDRARAVYIAYKERIELADQDIINAVFHGHPHLVKNLKCTYNFFWTHCADEFCNEVLENGVRILHGDDDTFINRRTDLSFIKEAFDAVRSINIYTDSYPRVFKDLSSAFNMSDRSNCSLLNPQLLYGRAATYFRNLDSLIEWRLKEN